MMNWRRALLSAVVLFVASACVPDIEEKDPDLGTEASSDDVSRAVTTATEKISLMNAQVGQYVTYEENYRIGMGAVVMMKQISHKLTQLTQDSTSLQCTMNEDYYEYYPSGAVKGESHTPLSFRFRKGMLATQMRSFFHPSDAECTCGGTAVCDDGDGVKYDCERFYNLKSEARTVDAPALVQQKADCSNFKNCQIDGTYIEYDEVKFLAGKVVRRVRLMAHLSPEVPDLYYFINTDGTYSYTPAATSFCSMSMEQIEDNKYEVEMCSVLRDVNTEPAPVPVVTPTPAPSVAPSPMPSAAPPAPINSPAPIPQPTPAPVPGSTPVP